MKITPQQIQMQLADFKLNPKQMPQLKVGDVFNGKIVEVQTGALLIALSDGGLIKAEVADVSRFIQGEQLDFQVVEQDQELTKVEILKTEMPKASEGIIKEQLQNVGLKITPTNVKAYDVLKRLDVDITKGNIETLSKNFKQLDLLHDNLEKIIPKQINTKVESPIKQMATVLEFESGEKLSKTEIKEVVIKMLTMMPEKAQVEPSKPQMVTDKSQAGMDKPQVDTDKAQLGTDKPVEKMSPEVLKEVFGLVRDVSTNKIDLEDTMLKIGQLFKLSKPVTLNNISILDKLIFENKVSDQVKTILPIIDKEIDAPKLLSLLKGFKISDFKNDQEVKTYFESLINNLNDVKDALSSRGKAQVEQLMSSINFLDKEQEDISWIQMPLQMNQQMKNLDILIKNNKDEGRKLTKENAKILIALETNHLENVQALIHVAGNRLKIDFKVANDQIKKVFDTEIGTLKKYFDEDYKQIDMKVETTQSMSFTDFINESNGGHINMTV